MHERCWIEISDAGAAMIATIDGELDFASQASVEASLRATMATASSLVIELGGLTFCDSSGVGMFLRLSADAKRTDTSLALRNPTRPVRRVFEMVRLNDSVPVTAGD